MKDVLRKIYYKLLTILPAKMVINIENLFTYKRFLKKDRVEYFGEKIQYLKLYGDLEKYTDLVDKYKVREYIKKELGEEYLIPLIGVYDKAEEIDFDKLPEKFILKSNNGSGCNLIVKEKKNLNINKAIKKANQWMKLDYYKIKKEPQYKNVERKIICEELINDKNGQLLDYKFFCFNGEPEFFQLDFDRFQNNKKNYYDLDWNMIEIQNSHYEHNYDKVEVPKNFDKMVEIAKKLSKKFQFVRVDLYNVDGKIYFGELTFTPASGRHAFYPLEKDKEIGSKIKIK